MCEADLRLTEMEYMAEEERITLPPVYTALQTVSRERTYSTMEIRWTLPLTMGKPLYKLKTSMAKQLETPGQGHICAHQPVDEL